MDELLTLQHKRLLRVDEAAKLLNVSRWTVYRWVEAGQLGGTRIGAGSLRIFSDTVAALINHHCVGASVPARERQEDQGSKESMRGNGRKGAAAGIGSLRRQATL